MQRIILSAGLGAAALAMGAGAALADSVPIGNWIVSETYDGRGVSRPTAILTSEGGASLVVSCSVRGLDVLVSYLKPMTKGEPLHVRWRLDGGAQHDQAWAVATDPSTFSSAAAEPAHAMLKQLAAAHSFTIVAAGHRDVFDLTGARQVSALAGGCPPSTAPTTTEPPAKSPATP